MDAQEQFKDVFGRMIDIGNQYEQNMHWSRDHQEELREMFQRFRDILTDTEGRSVDIAVTQMGLRRDDDAMVFSYMCLQNKEHKGDRAIFRSAAERLSLLQLFQMSFNKHGWYNIHNERDTGNFPERDDYSPEDAFRRIKTGIYFKSKALVNGLGAFQADDPQLSEVIVDDPVNDVIRNELKSVTHGMTTKADTNTALIIDYVGKEMAMRGFRIRNETLYKQKYITYLLPEDPAAMVCMVCNQPKHMHRCPPATDDPALWEPHVFRRKMREVSGRRINTQAFVKIDENDDQNSTIESFVNQVCKEHFVILRNPSTSQGYITPRIVQHYSKNRSDPYGKHLAPHRHTYSFQNGVLVLYTGRGTRPTFYPYECDDTCMERGCDCLKAMRPTTLSALKYFDTFYDWRTIQAQMEGENDKHRVPYEVDGKKRCCHCNREEHDHDDDHPFDPYELEFNPYRHIQTPFLTKIFADQDHKDEALNWMLALVIGRLMFEVNEVDQWQIFVNIVGVAGTGKSMLCNMIQKFFEQCDIGIINNNGQEKFMEGTLIHKRIVLGIEVDDKIDRALGRHSICAMASGDGINATIKGEKSIQIDRFKSHILMVSNTPLYKRDEGGSVFRRKVVIDFPNRITKTDGLYEERLKEEIPAILTRCVGMYLEYAERYGNQKFWNVCPAYFRDVREESRMKNNILELTIRSDLLLFNPNAYMSTQEFINKVREYTQSNNIRGLKMYTADQTKDIHVAFERQHKNIRIERTVRPTPGPGGAGRSTLKTWIVGVGDPENFPEIEPSMEEEEDNNGNPQSALDEFKQHMGSFTPSSSMSEDTLKQALDMMVRRFSSSFNSAEELFGQPQPYQGEEDDNFY